MKNTLKKLVDAFVSNASKGKKILSDAIGTIASTGTIACTLALTLGLASSAQAAWVEQGVMRYQAGTSYSATMISVEGKYKGNWIQVCYNYGGGDYGFDVQKDNFPDDATVTPVPEFKSGGKFVKMAWKVTAGATAIDGMLSPNTDVQIGKNDDAAIEIMKTGRGVVKGIKMVDDNPYYSTYNAQLNLYFRGTADVTDCDTYWFGPYWDREYYAGVQIVKDGPGYETGENGYHRCEDSKDPNLVTKFEDCDSGCIHTWSVKLQPGESKVYSFLLGIGEKADAPEWYYTEGQEVDDALVLRASGRTVTSIGKATDVATSGNITMYAMSTPNKFGTAGETNLAATAAAGVDTPVSLTGDFDTTGWAKGLYILDYWLVNDKGAMSADTIRKPVQIMEDGSLNVDPGDETTYLIEGSCINASVYTNFAIRVFGIGQDPNNTGVATTNDFDAVIDDKGVFYSLLPDGHYNVVITAWPKSQEKPITVTTLVDVLGAATTLEITLPTSAIDSVINDDATKFNGTVAGGLDQLGEDVKGSDASITNVVVELDVVDKTEAEPHAADLKAAAVGDDPTRACDFVDLSLYVATNQVTNAVHDTSAVTSDPTNQIIRIGLPFPDPKHCFVRVHRWHDNQVQQLPEGEANKTTDGEYFTINQDEGAVNGEVLLFVKKFSLYCISRGKAYARLRLNQPEYGTVQLALDSSFTEIIGDKYSPLWTETNVYVRCLANEGWIFQGFDADGLKVNDRITLSQERDFVLDGGSGEYYWIPEFKFKQTPAYSNATSGVVFETLDDLFADPWTKPGDRVVLTRDETIDAEGPLEITKDIVFDGNGHNLKVEKPFVKEDGSIDPNATTGGVIVVDAGVKVVITNMTVEGGAGAYAIENMGSLTLDEVTVKNSNGGITNAANAELFGRNSNIGHNVAANGAAIVSAGKVVLDGSSLCENRATGMGGALYASAATSKFYGNNVVFGNNSAVDRGGAIAIVDGVAYFQNATVAGNLTTTADGGAGVFVDSEKTCKFANSILANNFFYDTSANTQAADDFAAGPDSTVEVRACVYGALSGVTPVGGAAVTAASKDLFASYTAIKRLYGLAGCTEAIVDGLTVFAKKDAADALSMYAPISDAATAFRQAGAQQTFFAATNGTLAVTLKGSDYTYAEEIAGAAVVTTYYEQIGVRQAKMPGASGTATPVYTFTLRLKESPANGTVSGITLYGDPYEAGESVTVVATADAGCYFKGWYEEDGATLVSEDAIYTFNMPSANKVFVAKFEVLEPITTLWVEQTGWAAGDPAPAHTYGGKEPSTGDDIFEYAPTNDTSFWAVTKPVNPGIYYIKYTVAEAAPYAESSVSNVFAVGVRITYDAIGGAFADGLSTTNVIAPNGVYVLPAANPTREGYTFLGWYAGVTNGAPQVTASTYYQSLKVNEAFAKWKKNEATSQVDADIMKGTVSDGGVFDVAPTNKFATGDIVFTDRLGDSVDGPAIVSIAAKSFAYAPYQKKYSAPAIVSVTLPTFVTEVGNYAFWGNASLSNVTFSPVYDYKTGEKTTLYIKNYAFADTAITNLVFPAGGSYRLGYLAFAHNPNLKDVYILGDVSLDAFDKAPFREVGEGCGGTTFHLSPSAFANAKLVYALTNGLHMVSVREADSTAAVSDTPMGKVETSEFELHWDTITITFTLSADAPWQTVTTETVSLLYSNDPGHLIVGNCTKLAPEAVEKVGDEWKATFSKPDGATGFFTICVGE